MFVTIETLTRKSLNTPFPSGKLENELGKAIAKQQQARNLSTGWVGAAFEKTADGLTATITTIWTDQAGRDEFVAANKGLIDEIIALRAAYNAENGIVRKTVSRTEKLTLADAKNRLTNARARSLKLEKTRMAKLAKTV